MYLSKEKKEEIFGQYGKAQKVEDTGSAHTNPHKHHLFVGIFFIQTSNKSLHLHYSFSFFITVWG